MVRAIIYRVASLLFARLVANCGHGTFISRHAELKGKNIILGSNCRILKYCKLDTSTNPSNADYLKRTTSGRITIGDRVTLKEYVMLLSYDGHIKIGNYCSINPFTIVYGHGDVTIGNNVLIAANCVIVSSNHRFERADLPISQQGIRCKGISIGDDVWIGSNVKVLDGVKIEQGCIIAAGSVVTRDTVPFGIYGGVPARLMKRRSLKETV